MNKNVSVIDIGMWSNNGTRLEIANLSTPIKITFSKTQKKIKDQNVPDTGLFLKLQEMRYHSVYIPSYQATLTIRIKPKKNITLLVYIRKDLRPTYQQYDLNLTLPNSCWNATCGENNSCLSRGPYDFDLLPNATGHVGRHLIGIEIQKDSLNITGASSMVKSSGDNDDMARETEIGSCVREKPPPTTPPTAGKIVLRQFNPTMDVNYTFHVTVGSCVFWDIVTENWSVRGCQVSDKTQLFFYHFNEKLILRES